MNSRTACNVRFLCILRPELLGVFLAALFFGPASESLSAQSQLPTLQEIKLPVPMLRGMWWSAPLQSRWYFSILLTPDHALLVYEPNINGKWPLVKVSQWWTKTPESKVLSIPGWSGKDGKNLEALNTDLQMTQDGRYAVAFAIAEWRNSAEKPARKPDAIVTVIDLDQWQIVGSLHVADLALGSPHGERILRDDFLALKGSDWEPSRTVEHYKLFSLPALAPGPGCDIEEPHLSAEEQKKKDDKESRQRDENDAACAEVLTASASASAEDLDALVTTGRRPPPKDLQQSSYLLRNSLFGSPQGDWYSVDSIHSELARWNSNGLAQVKRPSPNLLCEKQPVEDPAWVCSCNIAGLAKDQNILLASCLTQHDNLLGWQVWLKQWLSVFRADDLSEIGFMRLSGKNEETKELIATAHGRTYVLAVSVGDTLRVYEVPGL